MQFAILFRKDPSNTPSPTEMQEAWGQWKSWMTKYAKEILEQSPARSGPKPGGAVAVCRGGAVTDGPYVEGKGDRRRLDVHPDRLAREGAGSRQGGAQLRQRRGHRDGEVLT